MSEKENSFEEEGEEIRSDTKEEITIKKGGTDVPNRKVAALILSGIGGAIYLFVGIILREGWFSPVSPALIAAGIISLGGTVIGAIRVKIGGWLIILTIPLSILVGTIFNLIAYSTIYGAIYSLAFILVPIPFPHSVFVILGGFLALYASDK
jgi:hypothetical protein